MIPRSQRCNERDADNKTHRKTRTYTIHHAKPQNTTWTKSFDKYARMCAREPQKRRNRWKLFLPDTKNARDRAPPARRTNAFFPVFLSGVVAENADIYHQRQSHAQRVGTPTATRCRFGFHRKTCRMTRLCSSPSSGLLTCWSTNDSRHALRTLHTALNSSRVILGTAATVFHRPSRLQRMARGKKEYAVSDKVPSFGRPAAMLETRSPPPAPQGPDQLVKDRPHQIFRGERILRRTRAPLLLPLRWSRTSKRSSRLPRGTALLPHFRALFDVASSCIQTNMYRL